MRVALAVAALVSLAGCMQTVTAPPVDPLPVQKIAARPGVSPRGASVAIVAFDGGPGETAQRFSAAFAAAAQAREITTVPADAAVYLLRGYLTATPADQGVRITYVCDLFDRRKQRAQRLTGDMMVPPRGPDPWAATDDAKLAALAAQGAQDLADVLTNTPEALMASGVPASGTRSVSGSSTVPRQAPILVRLRTGFADAR